MKAAALLVALCSTMVSAGIARVLCEEPPNEWGQSNCSFEDRSHCGGLCSMQCVEEIDRKGVAGFWRQSDNQCDCYCW